MTTQSQTGSGEDIPATAATTPYDTRLIDGPIVPTLISFSIPLVGTSLMHSVVGTYSAAWVGQVIGPNGLTAVVICNVLVWMLLMSVVFGVATASNIFIAQAYGAKNQTQLKAVVGNSVLFVIGGSILLALLGWFYAPWLVELISTPPEALEETIDYLRATCLSSLTVFPLVFVTMMIRGTGDARSPFVFSSIWLALFCVLGPVFLIGAFGAPVWGLPGMAYGSGLAAGATLLGLMIWLQVTQHPLAFKLSELSYFRPDLPTLSLLVQRGLPMGLEGLLISGVYLTLLSMVNQYGAETSAAYGASTQLWGYVQMPIGAIAASVSTIASQNIGAGRWDRIHELTWKSSAIAAGLTTLIVLIMFVFGDALLSLFLPDAGAPLQIALWINLLVLWSWIPLAVTMVIFGVVRANGAMIPPALIMIGALWLVRIPFADQLQPWLGADAIWWSFPAGTICCAGLAYAYYRWGAWRSKSLMQV